MAPVHGRLTKVFAGGYDLTAYFNDASVSQDVDLAETTTFGATAKSYVAGLKDGTVSLSGIFDGDADAVDARLSAMFGNSEVATVGFGGSALGTRARLLAGITQSYEISASIGDVVGVSADLQASGGIDAGVFLHELGAETATGNGSSHDNGAATSNGYAANLHVTATAGASPSTVCKVQHSTDNSVWVDLATFTAATAKTAEQKTGTGTVNRYTRARHELGGSTTSVTYTMAVARR